MAALMLFRAREQELDYNLKNNIYKSHANGTRAKCFALVVAVMQR